MPGRLHDLLPDAKLIYLLRDPIDRMVSHYLHNRQLGRERRTLADAVAARSYRNNYVHTSLYHFQISAFLDHFPLERVLIATTEDLRVPVRLCRSPVRGQRVRQVVQSDPGRHSNVRI